MKRVAAFTLAEMIIALLLMVIVISTAYAAYSIVSKTAVSNLARINYYTDLIKIDQISRNQVSASEHIRMNKEDSALWFKRQNELHWISTAGDSVFLYHSPGASDTFAVGARAHIGEMKDTLLNEKYIDRFTLVLPESDTQLTLVYHKQYAADFYINNTKY